MDNLKLYEVLQEWLTVFLLRLTFLLTFGHFVLKLHNTKKAATDHF